MLVYGDPWTTIDVAAWRKRAAAPLRGAWGEQHDELTARLIESGQLLQALEDAAFDAAGQRDLRRDALEPLRDHLTALARALMRSFDMRQAPPLPPAPNLPAQTPDRIRAREPEGYAFYALYPESYALAARRLGPKPDALVIGLRSIGASLAPMVAAGVGAASFITVRPKGPPFRREIDAPDLAETLARDPARDVLIVDEGPGLSGSSFASVAAFVRRHAPQSRVTLFPSHDGAPGGEADAQTRRLFETAPRLTHPMDALLHNALPDWIADLTGPLLAPLENLSGGAWRAQTYDRDADWPAVDAMQERVKFLARTERGAFLLKYVGVGDIGLRKTRMATSLGAAGLAPEALGVRRGFLVERWREDARPLDLRRDRRAIVPALARYLAFRMQHFRVRNAYGAAPAELAAMVERNIDLARGEASARAARARIAPLLARPSLPIRIASDNRMQVHEWLVAPDGALLKTDGVDHHAGHDLIGAQPVEYDLAAACVEFALTPAETAEIIRRLESDTGQLVDEDLVDAMRIVWLAFELGRAEMARYGCAAGPEAERLGARSAFLMKRLAAELAQRRSSQKRELQSHTLVWPT